MELLIGFEKEFYTNALLDEDQMELLNSVLSSIGAKLVKERGKFQYEIVISPYTVSLKSFDGALPSLHPLGDSSKTYRAPGLSKVEASAHEALESYKKQWHTLQDMLSEIKISFNDSPKPYADDYGSALQVSFSVDDFSKDDYLNAIYCILTNCKDFHHKINADSGFARFKPGFMAPTHICWGGNNNRTTLIRALNIDNTDIKDNSGCVNSNKQKKITRIEYRGANSNANARYLVEFILQMLTLSKKAKHPAYPQIWGNAYDKQYNLEEL